MLFKIDTKEKIIIFRLEEPVLDAKMAAEFRHTLSQIPGLATNNLILDLHFVESADAAGLEAIFTVYEQQYAAGLSAAVAGLNKILTSKLQDSYPSMLNIVPTESEAIDMVMMEDLERELNLDEE